MRELQNRFWTNKDEMVEEIEALGYEVEYVDGERIVFVDEDEEEYTMEVHQAGNTIYLI